MIFNENLFVFPFPNNAECIEGKIKINEIDEIYSIFIEKIDGYILVVAGR